MTTRGLVALGDSITNGHGEPALGVPAQSWALWVAEALDLPFHKLAADGARAPDVLRDLVPRLQGPYDVACVWIGATDTRSVDWDDDAFERDLTAIADAAGAASERLLLCTIPADLGRPPAGPKPLEAGAIIRRLAHRRGAALVDLDDLAGAPWMLPDAVHPTAVGQLEIADRAARALGAERLPSSLVEVHESLRAKARFGARYSALFARDVQRRLVERTRGVS